MQHYKGDLWIYVLESAQRDRIEHIARLKTRPMKYATPEELEKHSALITHARLELNEIMADLEKARGEA